MTSTEQRKAITSEELKQLSLQTWRNAHQDATPTEIARAEWRVKKLMCRERRRVGAMRAAGGQP